MVPHFGNSGDPHRAVDDVYACDPCAGQQTRAGSGGGSLGCSGRRRVRKSKIHT
ncbi:hypothetical protein SDC9_147267 [bioreactor metagenome]|uniref:Uncharacterized protein n=1 Tax=bioreactor metagenome TaxID=1076179 RepID=A0A645EHK5_9ZZZZ